MRFLFSLILLISMNVWGAELQLPALSSPVMDMAGFLSEAERNDLAELAYEINAHNGPQITIMTVPDMQDYPIEEFSIRVAEKWQLGTKERDNGLLVIIAKAERQMRIEVGNGIEGEVTDYDTTRYTKQLFPQYFKQGQFHAGLRIFMEEMAAKFNIKLNQGQSVVRRAPPRTKSKTGHFLIIAVIAILCFGNFLFKSRTPRGIFTGLGFTGVAFLMGLGSAALVLIFILGMALGISGIGNVLSAIMMSGRGGGGFGGGGGGFGGGGGGGWSGGGGGFSGGGSSGSW